MKNTSLIAVVLFILIVGGVGAYLLNQNAAPKMTKSDTTPKTEVSVQEETMMPQSKKYVPFSPEVLVGAANTRRVLFFYANWCPTCKPADQNFSEQVAQIPADVTVIRVNYNDTETDQVEKDLAKKYNITYQHTFVQIDTQGNPVATWNGGQMDELLENLK